MEREQLYNLTFSEAKSIIEKDDRKTLAHTYVAEGFGISIGVSDLFRRRISEKPMRIEGLRLVLVKSGQARVIINLITYEITAGSLIMVSDDSIVHLQSYSDDIDIMGLVLVDELLNLFFHGSPPETFCRKMNGFVLRLTPDECDIMERMLHLIWSVARQKGAGCETVGDLMAASIRFCDELNIEKVKEERQHKSRNQQLFDRFIALINTHVGEHHRLAFYANELCLTQRYLSTLIKQTSGVTAKAWIERALVMRIKVMLRHSDMQITQISDSLHFPNVSFFCKFFKRLTGLTPTEYQHAQ
ncbi:AraC family transcriptional regulator [Hoylesella marshii]|uniref:Transcriptional regulator, AraC family n=2 Tax=Hoylesella marshii TaxID=189722 RepID=E0NVL7_9BACT|nr:helix-turn-helix domain-containing protein [Hoylesella marshii]EFM00951.1 transcriptional regulator, AraC family [Hoylesella marshii DSM 16973 = JCM 13450]